MSPPPTQPRSSLLDLQAAVWSLIAVLPFLAFPLFNSVRWGSEATGLTTYDLPYYAANARAVLDRGHAGFYPNPFDPDPASPAIYFHWLILALAGLVGPARLDPGTALLIVQIVGALASARLMWSLVGELAGASRWRLAFYLSTMWGGGLFVVGKVVTNVATSRPWFDEPLAFDPGQGLWCLNFGRNLILPTEAIYHALMIGLWLCVMRGSWRTAALLLAAITSTHPFTGAQALAIVGTWIAIQWSLRWFRKTSPVPSTPGWIAAIAMALVAGVFVAYYFVYLPRFPQHRAIQETWTLGWTLTRRMILLAYAPAAMLAWLALRNDVVWRRRVGFLCVAAGVSFLLANHQWFITPRQPIHFTRGYIWTPLWLAGWPTLERLLNRLASQSLALVAIAGLPLAALIVSDNAGFLAANALGKERPGFGLTSDERQILRDVPQLSSHGVLLTDDARLGYLAAVYTHARPWIGHKYNTPDFDDRETRLTVFKSTNAAGEILDEVDIVMTANPHVQQRLAAAEWQPIKRSGPLTLWLRGTPRAQPLP